MYDSDILLDIYFLLNDRLPEIEFSLGYSEMEDPPPLHEVFDSDIASFSIGTQTNYPYTGGGFAAVNTNYGNGIIVIPNPYRKDTLGFQKGTDRIVNLTPSTITGFWVMGGSTYNLRLTALGQPEYYYYNGSTYVWRALSISSMTDSNIQFLDETGERGIQRPFFSLTDRLFVILIVILLFSMFFRRRS